MDLSEFTFKILLLFFPGIIAAIIIDTFSIHEKRTPFFFLTYSFVLGVSSYFLYWLLINIGPIFCRYPLNSINFFQSLTMQNIPLDIREVAFVTLTSIIFSIIVVFILTYKVHFRIARVLKLSKKSGELDIWGYTMNIPDFEYATVRNYSKDLMYDGYIEAFSDDSKNAELLLSEVMVYRNSDAKHLYSVGAIYLSLSREDIEIEFRGIEKENTHTGE